MNDAENPDVYFSVWIEIERVNWKENEYDPVTEPPIHTANFSNEQAAFKFAEGIRVIADLLDAAPADAVVAIKAALERLEMNDG